MLHVASSPMMLSILFPLAPDWEVLVLIEMITSLVPQSLPKFSVCNYNSQESLTIVSQETLTDLLNTKSQYSLQLLRQTHCLLIKLGLSNDNFVAGSLVKNYSNRQFFSLNDAVKVFNEVPQPHLFLWNSMIRGYVDNGSVNKALSLYNKMVLDSYMGNKFSYPLLFKACTASRELKGAKQIHGHVVKLGFAGDKYIRSAAIQMYSCFGFLKEAIGLFSGGDDIDCVCWNAMIDAYFKNGDIRNAETLFDRMTYRNVGSWNVMISGYTKCGKINDAREMFDRMPERNDVSWSAIIDGYIQMNCFKDALDMFRIMLKEEIRPQKYLLSSVLTACANLGAIDQGRWIHTYIERNSISLDPILGTSLVDMYAKCGCLDMAKAVFNRMPRKEIFSWNAMINGFAMHGRAQDAIHLFTKMDKGKIRPDGITFIGVLNACAHAGLIEEGQKYYSLMKEVHRIEPTIEHYGCMVDLLGRAGLFSEAQELINSMPIKPNAVVWGSLLGACRIHGNIELGEKVGKILLEIEPNNGGRYAILSNIYAKVGRWDDVAKVRKLMKERGIKTTPGSSLIELDGVVHEFLMGDSSHPRSKEIHSMLNEMIERIKMEGYIPNTRHVLFDIDEEEKETSICHHSEKLAISYGILCTKPGQTIRIVKNLRICEDCHCASKIISHVYNREIIVRDRIRYHHFRNGTCSCKDFW